jgi:hypothetical protein
MRGLKVYETQNLSLSYLKIYSVTKSELKLQSQLSQFRCASCLSPLN